MRNREKDLDILKKSKVLYNFINLLIYYEDSKTYSRNY